MTEDLWQEYKSRMQVYIARRVGDPDAVEDILQDVFLKAHTNRHLIKSRDSIVAWLYRVAANAIADYYRSQKASEEMPDDIAEPEPEQNYIAELAECLAPLIAELPSTYQKALELAELEGLPQKDVAETLGISLSGAKSRIQRGREKLRERLLRCCDIETGRVGIVGFEQREWSDKVCG